jgi:hypothetical protein
MIKCIMSRYYCTKKKHIINHLFPKTWIIKKTQQTKIEHKNFHLPSLAWRTQIWIAPPHSTLTKKKRGGSTNLNQEEQSSKVEQEKQGEVKARV